DEVPASELGAQTTLLDHGLDKGVALSGASLDDFAGGCLLLAQPRDETLRIGHDLHPSSKIHRRRVDLETHLGDFTTREPKERYGGAHRQPSQGFVEMQHIAR